MAWQWLSVVHATRFSSEPTAVRVQRLSGEVARQIAAQEHDHVRDFFRLTEPTERDVLEHLGLNLRRDRLAHLGENDARRDGVHGDAPPRKFLTQYLGDRDDSRLGCRVVHLSVEPDDSRDRRHVDDPSVRRHSFVRRRLDRRERPP